MVKLVSCLLDVQSLFEREKGQDHEVATKVCIARKAMGEHDGVSPHAIVCSYNSECSVAAFMWQTCSRAEMGSDVCVVLAEVSWGT